MPQALPSGREIATGGRRPTRGYRRLVGLLAAAAAALLPSSIALSSQDGAAERGAYVLRAAGCVACHTAGKDGAFLAGGPPLKTPYGTFFAPNITPDPDHGLGRWSEADFREAVKHGRAPNGAGYYPAFPYTSYAAMTDADLADLWAYLETVPPVALPDRPHELAFPFGLRIMATAWRTLFFEQDGFAPQPERDEAWNRGAYLVRHLGHCGECHSPRGVFGAVERERALAGNRSGPEGKKVPNITPHDEQGIGDWSETDMTFFLKTGILPDGDVAGGAMEDVIRQSTAHLTDRDRAAIALYLRSLAPLPGP